MPYSCKQFLRPDSWSDNQRVKSPNDLLFAYIVRQSLECFNTFFYRGYIRFKAFLCVVIQCYLKVIMNPHLVQYMKIRHYWFGILRPKHNGLALTERYIHLLLIERIIPSTITFSQAVEKPLGIKGWYISRAAGRDNNRCCRLYLFASIACNDVLICLHNDSLTPHKLYLQLLCLCLYLLVSKNSLQSFYFLQDNIFLCEILYLLR